MTEMKCGACAKGRLEPQPGPYHYSECGLPNVYLVGINWWVCSECGSAEAEIPQVGKLHRYLGWKVVTKKSYLSGEEIRFLRKQLRLRQGEFAELLGQSQTVLSRWETGDRNHSKANDLLVRMIYLYGEDDEFTHDFSKEVRRCLMKYLGDIPSGFIKLADLSVDPASVSPEAEREAFSQELAGCAGSP